MAEKFNMGVTVGRTYLVYMTGGTFEGKLVGSVTGAGGAVCAMTFQNDEWKLTVDVNFIAAIAHPRVSSPRPAAHLSGAQ